MKKYISILGVVTVSVLESCERNDSGMTESDDQDQSAVNYQRESISPENVPSDEAGAAGFRETGDDDPPKDKQHWKTVNDTLR
jgi:hypothetical protein